MKTTNEKLVDWITLCQVDASRGGMFPDHRGNDEGFLIELAFAIQEMMDKAHLYGLMVD